MSAKSKGFVAGILVGVVAYHIVSQGGISKKSS
jgi:hypothetical protein